MKYRKCGRSDLELSAVGLGCWAFGSGKYWGEQSQKDVEEVVLGAVDLGINYFDTAEAYNDGSSESSLGDALKSVPREKVVIGTKISPSNTEPAVLKKHCDDSLKRLKTDYIDLYMVHWPITPHSIKHFTDKEICPSTEDAFATLAELRKEGKIRHIGVSNFNVRPLDQALSTEVQLEVNQLPYSLLTRGIEWDILPECAIRGIGVIGYMSLMQGVLADIYPNLDEVPVFQRRTRHFDSRKNREARHSDNGAEQATNEALASIRILCRECRMTMPEIALKWAMYRKEITCSLVGSRNLKELRDNVKTADIPLDEDIFKRLNEITEGLKVKLGRSFDYYESLLNDRTR